MVATVGSIEVTLKLLGAEKYAADFGRSAAATEQAAGRIGKATSSAGRSAEGLGSSLASLTQSGGGLNSIAISALRAGSGVAGLTKAFHALGAAIGGVGGAVALKFVTEYADAYTNVQNRIASITKSQADRIPVENELFAIAQRSRASLDSTVQLYQRLSLASGNLGASQKDIFKVVETTQKAFQTGGSTAAEAASTATQLAQALGSGRLAGDEFRAISENAPVLFQALAKEFNVSTGELKQMASDGELTAKRVFKAIINASKDVDEAFARTSPTIAAGIQQVDNALTRYIGQADKSLGASKTLSEGLKSVADNMKGIGDTVVSVVELIGLALATRALGGIGTRLAAPFKEANRLAVEELAKSKALADSAREAQAAALQHQAAKAKELSDFQKLPIGQRADPELEKRRQSQLGELEKLDKQAAKLTQEQTKLTQQLGNVEQSVSGASVAATNRLEAAKSKLAATQTKLVDLVARQGTLDQAAATAGGGVLRKDQQAYYNALARTVDARDALTDLNAQIAKSKTEIEQLKLARQTYTDRGATGAAQDATNRIMAQEKQLQAMQDQRFAKGREIQTAERQLADSESAIINRQMSEREKAAIAQAKGADDISRARAKESSQLADVAKQESAFQNQRVTGAQTTANKINQIEQQVTQNAMNQRANAAERARVTGALGETAAQIPISAGVQMTARARELEGATNGLTVANDGAAAAAGRLSSAQAKTNTILYAGSLAAKSIGSAISTGFSALVAGLGGGIPATLFAITAAWIALDAVQAHNVQTVKESQDALQGLVDKFKEFQDRLERHQSFTASERILNIGELQKGQKALDDAYDSLTRFLDKVAQPSGFVSDLFGNLVSSSSELDDAFKKGGINIEEYRKKIKDAQKDPTELAGVVTELKNKLVDLGNAQPDMLPFINSMIASLNSVLSLGAAAVTAKAQIYSLGSAAAAARSKANEYGTTGPPTAEETAAGSRERSDALRKQRFDLEHAADEAIEADYKEFEKRRADGIGQLRTETRKLQTKKGGIDRAREEAGEKFGRFGSPEEVETYAQALAADRAKAPKKGRAPKKSQETKDAETLEKKLRELDEEARSSGLSALDEKTVKFAQSAKVATTDINQFIEAVTNKDLDKVPATMQAIKDGLEKIEAAKFGRKALDDLFPAEKLAHDLHLLDVAAAGTPQIAANLSQLKFKEIAKNASDFSKDAASAIGEFALSAITDFKNVGTALEALAKSLEKAILQATIIKPLEEAIKVGLGGTLGGEGNIFSAIFKGIGSIGSSAGSTASLSTGAGLYHGGGLVGIEAARTKQVSMAAFAGAQRFHGGFTAREFPAILEYGERVLTAKQQQKTMSTMNGLTNMGPPVSFAPKINIVNNAGAKITTKSGGGPGGPSLDVLIDSMVAEKLSTPGTASNRASRTFLGSRQQLTSR